MITGLRTEPRAALIGGLRQPLSPTESKVLQLLIDTGDTPISRASLESKLYVTVTCKSNVVEVTICRLRQKLQHHGYRIHATRGRGYTISQAGAA